MKELQQRTLCYQYVPLNYNSGCENTRAGTKSMEYEVHIFLFCLFTLTCLLVGKKYVHIFIRVIPDYFVTYKICNTLQ